jgi:murein DD-endopeptidase MepM/ murein hydrolase activator NlpD
MPRTRRRNHLITLPPQCYPKYSMRFASPIPCLLFAALIFPLTNAAAIQNWKVQYEPARVVNGSPVIIRVSTPKPVQKLSGHWLDHDFDFSFDQQTHTWFALAGAALTTKAGVYPLQLHAEAGSGQSQAISYEKKIPVHLQRYPRTVLKVPDRYTAPSADDQKEIEEDKKIKESAFKTLTPEREWEGSFALPVEAEVSDSFGVERVFNGSVQSTHQGTDFRVGTGTSVAAVNRGKVILAQPLFFEGNCIVIDHGQGLLTLYLHLSKFLVHPGDEVTKGQPIGRSGGTGRATGPHLHLAVRWQGVYLNPKILLGLKLP